MIDTTPFNGCVGCQSTAGRLGCTTHGRGQIVITRPTPEEIEVARNSDWYIGWRAGYDAGYRAGQREFRGVLADDGYDGPLP